MTDLISNTDHQVEHKLTALDVENECPDRLKSIAKEIKERLVKYEKQKQVAQDHLVAIGQLLAEARDLCDRDGFKKFRELYCPQLGKTQAYAMRAIAAGKKSLAQHRAEESERKRRTRARQRAATESGTVPENRLVQQDDPIEAGQAETDAAEPEQTPELGEQRDAEPTGNSTKKKPESRRSGVAREDTALIYFNERVLDLIQKTKSQKIERFVKTAIPADDLGRLGNSSAALRTS
jgi:hypothetical protein